MGYAKDTLSETERRYRDQKKIVAAATRDQLRELQGRDRAVLSWRFGLSGQGWHTYEEIGEKLHLSRERCSQITRRAITRLQDVMTAERGD